MFLYQSKWDANVSELLKLTYFFLKKAFEIALERKASWARVKPTEQFYFIFFSFIVLL